MSRISDRLQGLAYRQMEEITELERQLTEARANQLQPGCISVPILLIDEVMRDLSNAQGHTVDTSAEMMNLLDILDPPTDTANPLPTIVEVAGSGPDYASEFDSVEYVRRMRRSYSRPADPFYLPYAFELGEEFDEVGDSGE